MEATISEAAEMIAQVSLLIMDSDEIAEILQNMVDDGGNFAIWAVDGMGEIEHFTGEWPPDVDDHWTLIYTSNRGATHDGRDREAQLEAAWDPIKPLLRRRRR